MKKLLVLGLSACLLFSFTGSAFAASPTNTKASEKTVHAAAVKKKTVKNSTHTKKQTVSHTNVNAKKALKKAVKTAKTKVAKN